MPLRIAALGQQTIAIDNDAGSNNVENSMLLSFSPYLLDDARLPRILRLLTRLKLAAGNNNNNKNNRGGSDGNDTICMLPARGWIHRYASRTTGGDEYILLEETRIVDMLRRMMFDGATDVDLVNMLHQVNAVRIQEIRLGEGKHAYVWKQSTLDREDGIGPSVPLILDGRGNCVATVSSWRAPTPSLIMSPTEREQQEQEQQEREQQEREQREQEEAFANVVRALRRPI